MKKLPRVRRVTVTKPVPPKPDALPRVEGFSPSSLINRTTLSEFNEAVAEEAVSYTASKFLGRGKYDTRPAKTLAAARRHAKAMGVEQTMIYAINKEGRQVLIEAGGKKIKQ